MTDSSAAAARLLLRLRRTADPYSVFTELAALGRVLAVPSLSLTVVCSREESAEVLADPRTFPVPGAGWRDGRDPSWRDRPAQVDLVSSLLYTDGTAHRALRRPVARLLSRTALDAAFPVLQEEVARTVSEVREDLRHGGGRTDLAEPVTVLLPARVLCAVMGVPRTEAAQLAGWIRRFAALGELFATPGQIADAEAAHAEVRTWHAARQTTVQPVPGGEDGERRRPTSTDHGPLPGGQLETGFAELALVFQAGFVTLAGLLGTLTRRLLSEPWAVHRLRAQPQAVPNWVEDTLAWWPPATAVSRICARRAVVGGTEIEAGRQVLVSLAGAARAPWPSRPPGPGALGSCSAPPYALRPAGHLAFGAGPHRCPGEALTRTLAALFTTSFLTGLPDLHADMGEQPDGPAYTGLALPHHTRLAAVRTRLAG